MGWPKDTDGRDDINKHTAPVTRLNSFHGLSYLILRTTL